MRWTLWRYTIPALFNGWHVGTPPHSPDSPIMSTEVVPIGDYNKIQREYFEQKRERKGWANRAAAAEAIARDAIRAAQQLLNAVSQDY